MISKPETWTDIAFLQIVSDMCQVAIHVTGVSDLSKIVPDMLLLLPCDKKPLKALLRVGYWLDRHLAHPTASVPESSVTSRAVWEGAYLQPPAGASGAFAPQSPVGAVAST